VLGIGQLGLEGPGLLHLLPLGPQRLAEQIELGRLVLLGSGGKTTIVATVAGVGDTIVVVRFLYNIILLLLVHGTKRNNAL